MNFKEYFKKDSNLNEDVGTASIIKYKKSKIFNEFVDLIETYITTTGAIKRTPGDLTLSICTDAANVIKKDLEKSVFDEQDLKLEIKKIDEYLQRLAEALYGL